MSLHPLHDEVTEILRHVSDDIILPYFGNLKASDIAEKTPGDLVTIADKESESVLSARLEKLINGAAIVGEEAAAADESVLLGLAAPSCWIIDPIDGTGNYAAGKQPFGILIALAEHGETVAAWIYDPIGQRLCHAHSGNGAYIDGTRISALTSNGKLPIAALATGFMTAEQKKATLGAASGNYQIVDIPRCCAEQYPRLALGQNDLSIFERTLPWDHAAGILFVNEAGGKACRFDGTPYRPTDKGSGLLAAASSEIWEEAAAIFGNYT